MCPPRLLRPFGRGVGEWSDGSAHVLNFVREPQYRQESRFGGKARRLVTEGFRELPYSNFLD